MTVDGRLRAQHNTASSGGFAYLEQDGAAGWKGVLQFTDSAAATACISNNTAVAISISSINPAGHVLCGSNSTASWQPGDYDVTGQVCACNAAFVAGTASTCNSSCAGAAAVQGGSGQERCEQDISPSFLAAVPLSA